MSQARSKLLDRKILIAEDDIATGHDLRELMEREGAEVWLATSVPFALSLLKTLAFEGAILDARLEEEMSEPVAALLKTRKIPFVVVTGYASSVLPAALKAAPRITKPYKPGELIAKAVELFTLKA